MKRNIANLCFVTDSGYTMPTCVALVSALKNKKLGSIYNVFILHKGLNFYEKQNFMKLDCDRFRINLIDIGKYEDFSGYELANVHATPTSIYKFFLPEILSNLDKVLFLDGDIVVQNDLTRLYNIDLNNYYVAAVKDNSGIDYRIHRNDYCYFNSGVMLLNLKKMRNNNTKGAMLEYRKNGLNKLMDQDTFNYVFNGSVKLLPFKYNTQTNVLSAIAQRKIGYNFSDIAKYWNIEIDEKCEGVLGSILDVAVIVHYASIKPWKYYDGFGSELWYQYYASSPYKDKKLRLQSYYISDLINCDTYRIGKIVIAPFSLLKRICLVFSNHKYRKFLLKFRITKRNRG